MLKLDPIWQASCQQQLYRSLLEAMSRPGMCFDILNRPQEGTVAMSVLATLLDNEVSLADEHGQLRNQDWTLLQAIPVTVDKADYILCHGQQSPDFVPKRGTLHSPEQSATLIMVVDEIVQSKIQPGDLNLRLTGPGIEVTRKLALNGLQREWIASREQWNDSFPLGVDFIIVDAHHFVALPRSTRVELL